MVMISVTSQLAWNYCNPKQQWAYVHKQSNEELVWIPYLKRKRVNGERKLDVTFEPASAVKSLTSFLASCLRCHKDNTIKKPVQNYTINL